MPASTERPFESWGLPKAEVVKHFQPGDMVAFTQKSNKGRWRASATDDYGVQFGTLVSVEPHRYVALRYGEPAVVRPITAREKWQTEGVGFVVRLSDGRELTTKTIFGTEKATKAAQAEAKQRQTAHVAAVAEREARNLRNAKKVAAALKAAGVDVAWWDHETRTGKTPRLTIEQLATVLGVEVEV